MARKHGAASVAGRRREMEDAVSVREAFALAEGSHGGWRDFLDRGDGAQLRADGQRGEGCGAAR